MAHIPDGIAPPALLVAATAFSAVGCAIGLKRLDTQRIPQVAILSSAFFVASLVHFPVGPSNVHLLLTGLTGIMLGWAAFPAILIALLLQALMFGFGGITTLGINTLNMALPALICGWAFRRLPRRPLMAGLCGGGGVVLTVLGVAATLAASGREFWPAIHLLVLSHLPVVVIEAVFTAAVIGLLVRVRPQSLDLS